MVKKGKQVKIDEVQIAEKEVQLRAQLARALADYDNLTKRIERERSEIQKLVGFSILERLLPVLENLEKVQKHISDEGLAIAIANFKEVLKSEGLEEIEVQVREAFDETIHEAVEVESKPEAANTIMEGLQNGWKFNNGPLVRAAKVKVYK